MGDQGAVSAAPRPATEDPGADPRPEDDGWALLDGPDDSSPRKRTPQVPQDPLRYFGWSLMAGMAFFAMGTSAFGSLAEMTMASTSAGVT